MMEEIDDEECVVRCIKEYIKTNKVEELFTLPMRRIVYTEENIQRYLDAYLFLDISNINEFIDYIVHDYILLQRRLLAPIHHYDIIMQKIDKVLHKGTSITPPDEISLIYHTFIDYPHKCNKILNDKSLLYIYDYIKFQYLDAVSEDISDTSVSRLTSLTYLNARGSIKITNLSVYNLVNLTHLDASNNSTITDRSVSRLKNLTSLTMFNNLNITDVSIYNLPQLTSIHLRRTVITDESIKTLKHLKSLVIYGNNISSSIGHLTSLTHLDIAENHMIADSVLYNLKNLRHLFLSGCIGITDSSVSTLTNLETLSIRDVYNISDMSIEKLTNLTFLYVSSITNIHTHKVSDSSISKLTKLKHLECVNAMSITDSSIVTLKNLTYLSCNNCDKITDMSISGLTNLTHLGVTYCKEITDISISRLSNLTHLSIMFNRCITYQSISKLPKLLYLDISNYNNTFLPESCFCNLEKLIYLSLIWDTKIIPESIRMLKNLKSLTGYISQPDISYNLENHAIVPQHVYHSHFYRKYYNYNIL